MAKPPDHPPSPFQGTHLVLYDGVCGLCNRLVAFMLEHDERGVFAFASLQSGVGKEIVSRFGGNPDEPASFYVLANYRSSQAQVFSRSGAALLVAGELGWPWRAAAWLRVLPSAILDRVYDAIARGRYRLFGRFEECPIPRPEFRGRFIDTAAGD